MWFSFIHAFLVIVSFFYFILLIFCVIIFSDFVSLNQSKYHNLSFVELFFPFQPWSTMKAKMNVLVFKKLVWLVQPLCGITRWVLVLLHEIFIFRQDVSSVTQDGLCAGPQLLLCSAMRREDELWCLLTHQNSWRHSSCSHQQAAMDLQCGMPVWVHEDCLWCLPRWQTGKITFRSQRKTLLYVCESVFSVSDRFDLCALCKNVWNNLE